MAGLLSVKLLWDTRESSHQLLFLRESLTAS